MSQIGCECSDGWITFTETLLLCLCFNKNAKAELTEKNVQKLSSVTTKLILLSLTSHKISKKTCLCTFGRIEANLLCSGGIHNTQLARTVKTY